MSFNKLLYDHQVALLRAARPKPAIIGPDLVDHYEVLLQKARHKLGVAQYPVAIKLADKLPNPQLAQQGNLS